MMKRLMFAAAAAAWLLGPAFPAAAQEKVTIAVGSTVIDVSQANDTSVPIYTKCWEKAGLAVDIQPTNTNAAIQAMLTGQVEFVLAGPEAAIIARAKGAPVRAVYLNIARNFVFLVVPEASPIKTLADFKGKTVGIFSYGSQQYREFKGMIAEAGLDPEKDVTWIETGVGAQAIAALQSGRVDAWGTWDSQLATAENVGLKFRRFTTPSAEKLNWGSSLWVTDRYAAAKPEVIGKLLRCVAEGSVYTSTNPEAAVRAHWAVYPATKPSGMPDAEAMRQALNIIKTRIEFITPEPGMKWGEMPAGAAANTVDFMKQTGELKGTLNPADLFTNSFVTATNDFDLTQVQASARGAK